MSVPARGCVTRAQKGFPSVCRRKPRHTSTPGCARVQAQRVCRWCVDGCKDALISELAWQFVLDCAARALSWPARGAPRGLPYGRRPIGFAGFLWVRRRAGLAPSGAPESNRSPATTCEQEAKENPPKRTTLRAGLGFTRALHLSGSPQSSLPNRGPCHPSHRQARLSAAAPQRHLL